MEKREKENMKGEKEDKEENVRSFVCVEWWNI